MGPQLQTTLVVAGFKCSADPANPFLIEGVCVKTGDRAEFICHFCDAMLAESFSLLWSNSNFSPIRSLKFKAAPLRKTNHAHPWITNTFRFGTSAG
jgi:hypothetical protein